MKILVTGRAIPQQPDRCTSQQLVDGFNQAGHEAVFYGNFYGEPHRWLGSDEAANGNFDLIIIGEMNDGYSSYPLNTLNLKGTPRLYWDFDVSYHPDLSYSRATAYKPDGYLVGNRYYCGKDAFGRFSKPTLHLPYACSPHIHRKMPEIQKNHLLGFVGSLTEERKRLIDLAEKNAIKRTWVHSAEGIFGDDLIRQTNAYLVMFHNNQDACKGLVPGRPWETIGCGTTLLMDRTSYEDFIEFLPERFYQDIFVYDNDTDIRAWLSRYTLWDSCDLLLGMAGENLMHYAHKNHSYKNRAEGIIEWWKKTKTLAT